MPDRGIFFSTEFCQGVFSTVFRSEFQFPLSQTVLVFIKVKTKKLVEPSDTDAFNFVKCLASFFFLKKLF